MAKLLLIAANQVVDPYPVYPLGIAYLTTALEKHGHEVEQFDVLASGGISGLVTYLLANTFDIVGVSIRNLDSVVSHDIHDFLDDTGQVVKTVRAHSKAVLVLGGPAFAIMPEKLFALLGADYGIAGEGEILFPQLVNDIMVGNPPNQKVMRSEPNRNPWLTATINRDAVDFYLGRGGMLNVQTKRGCPHKCVYCSYPTIEGAKMRYRDPQEVAQEVARMTEEYGAKYIFFTDGVFNDSKGHFREVAKALIANNNKTPFCAYFRPQGLTESDFALLKKAGLATMELGTDGAADSTIKALGKGFTFADALATSDMAADYGIACAHFVMFGGPEEDEESLQEGLANLASIQDAIVFVYLGIRILPRTRIWQIAVDDGLITADEPLLKPKYYISPKISRERLDTAIAQSFGTRPDRFYPCVDLEKKVKMMHEVGYIGPMWDTLIANRLRKRAEEKK